MTPALLAETQGWLDDVAAASALRGCREVLCVDDSGDRALAHALGGAAVTVISRAPPLVELKRVGGAVAWEEQLQLLGLLPFGRRVFEYHRARDRISDSARRFWDAREAWVREGLLAAGAVEQRAARMRERLVPWVCSRDELRAALAGDGRGLDGARWRIWASRHLGALAAARLPMLSGADNPFTEWLLTGRFAEPARARVYLSREGHRGLPGLRLKLLSSWGELPPAQRFDGLDLGRGGFAEESMKWASPGASLLWWSAAAEPPAGATSLTPPLPDRSPLAPPLRLARLG